MIIQALALMSLAQAAVQPAALPWEQVKVEDGITVYRREVPGSDVLAFRGVGLIDAPVAKIASILVDTKRGPEWVEDLDSATILRWTDPLHYIEYDHVGTPIIIKDRDFVSAVEIKIDRQKRQISFRYRATEDKDAPKTSYVRGELLDTTFTLTDVDGKTQLDGSVEADPKGSVPKWLVNFFQKDWPVHTLERMRKQAAKNDVVIDPRFLF